MKETKTSTLDSNYFLKEFEIDHVKFRKKWINNQHIQLVKWKSIWHDDWMIEKCNLNVSWNIVSEFKNEDKMSYE